MASGIAVRLDRFLKVSRLVKRRTLAKDLADGGRIRVNDRQAKPATEVQIGDRIILDFAGKVLTVEVLDIRSAVRAQEASSMYRILSHAAKD